MGISILVRRCLYIESGLWEQSHGTPISGGCATVIPVSRCRVVVAVRSLWAWASVHSQAVRHPWHSLAKLKAAASRERANWRRWQAARNHHCSWGAVCRHRTYPLHGGHTVAAEHKPHLFLLLRFEFQTFCGTEFFFLLQRYLSGSNWALSLRSGSAG